MLSAFFWLFVIYIIGVVAAALLMIVLAVIEDEVELRPIAYASAWSWIVIAVCALIVVERALGYLWGYVKQVCKV